jgi:hypothetical protein
MQRLENDDIANHDESLDEAMINGGSWFESGASRAGENFKELRNSVPGTDAENRRLAESRAL